MLGETRRSAPAESAVGVRVLRRVRESTAGGWTPRVREAAVAPEHPVRAIWGMLYKLELPAFYGSIQPVVEMSDVLRFRWTGHPTTSHLFESLNESRFSK